MQKSIFINDRLLSMFLLGFCSGLPLALTNSTLQAWFSDAGINLITIGAITLIGIPYTIKFLWAPIMDALNIPKVGKRKGWILITQAFVGVSLLLLAVLEPTTEAGLMGMVALSIAFFAASQDISIDAYRTDVLKPHERGLGISYFVFAYRIAMLLSGGAALIFADHIGWRLTYMCMAGFIFFSILVTAFLPSPAHLNNHTEELVQVTKMAARDLLQHDKIFMILIFIFLYKFGDALALSLMTPFLRNGLGFSLSEIGYAFKTLGPFAIILGGILGGVLLTRWNIYLALIVFGSLQALSNLSFVLLAIADKHFWLMTSAICFENFCSGLSTAALLAFLMSLCNKKYSATQYALLSAVMSLGRVFIGPFAGALVLAIGWPQFFVISFVLCFPSIVLLMFIKDKVVNYAPATAD